MIWPLFAALPKQILTAGHPIPSHRNRGGWPLAIHLIHSPCITLSRLLYILHTIDLSATSLSVSEHGATVLRGPSHQGYHINTSPILATDSRRYSLGSRTSLRTPKRRPHKPWLTWAIVCVVAACYCRFHGRSALLSSSYGSSSGAQQQRRFQQTPTLYGYAVPHRLPLFSRNRADGYYR
jgi:hypothetical protein